MRGGKQGPVCLPFASLRAIFLKPDLIILSTWFKTFAYRRKPEPFELTYMTFATGFPLSLQLQPSSFHGNIQPQGSMSFF